MADEELYECHNFNNDGKNCGYRGSNRDATKCPMCGGIIRSTDWFVKGEEGDEYDFKY